MTTRLSPRGLGRTWIGCLGLVIALGVRPCASAALPDATVPEAVYRVLQDRPDRLMVELPNRLIVIAQELHAAPVVSVQVWVKTGSIYEGGDAGAGLSHFLEHLLSAGTTTARSEEQSNEILGAIGAETNAATGLDNVHYYINTTSPHAERAIDLITDWMQHSLIPEEEYQRERSVIQREFEMGQGEPDRILWKLTQQARYSLHPARHPTIGYLDEFLRITRDQIADFYRRMYVPNNMVFVVVGDIDRRRVVDRVVELWRRAEPRDLPAVEFPVELSPIGERQVTGVAGIDKPRLRLAWPGTRLAAEGDYALDLLAVILGQGESSRLTRTVRDEQRAVNTVRSYNLSFAWGEGFFGIDAEVAVPEGPASATGDAASDAASAADQAILRAKAAILEQVDRLRNEPVTPEELARAKRTILADVVLQAQSAQDIAARLASDTIGTGDPDYLRRYSQAIQSLSVDQVKAAAEKFLDPGHLIAITLLPPSEDHPPIPITRPPTPPDAAAIDTERVDLDNTTIVERFTPLAIAQPQALRPIEIQPLQRYTLPNGLRLIVGRTTTVPAVAMQIYHLGGLLADAPGREGIAYAVSAMRTRGTATRTAEQIAQQIENLGASLEADCGNNTWYTRAVCLAEDWPAVLEIFADVTLNPTFPEDEWGKIQPLLLAAVERQADTWSDELVLRFREAYFREHPWSRSPLGRNEVIASLRPEDLRLFHRRSLAASQSVLAVVGDVDPEQVRADVERLFTSMPARAQAPVIPPLPVPPASTVVQSQTDKPLAAVQIGFGPGVTRRSPDFPTLQVLASVLNSFPTGWLEQELRGRGPGLVYVVGAGQFTGFVPGYFGVVFNTQPQAVPLALQRAIAVVDRARTEPVDRATLDRAKAKVLAEEFLGKQSNAERAADAALLELFGLPPDEPQRLIERVQSLTAEQLQTAARAYLRNPVVVVLTHQPLPQAELDQAIMLPATEPDPSTSAAASTDAHD